MDEELTETEFSKHLNTNFQFDCGPEGKLDLTLVEVKTYNPNPGDQTGLERFSLFFRGPAKPILAQQIYSINHDAMGPMHIFIVPLEPDSKGPQYEAVFNYYKNK